jgi:hypothetical protein
MSVINSIFNVLRFNKRNWKAVVLCVFAATVFWFFNALNKSYTANIIFPLAFDYQQEGYIPVRPLPNDIRINVTGVGWNLFRRSIGIKVPPLVIPMERPTEIKKIVGSTLPALFANQLEGFEINFVLTDTLYIAIEPRATRWMDVQLDTPSILFRDGYGLSGPVTIKPDSIFIEGPLGLIRKLAEPHNMKLTRRNIDEDFSDEVEVKFLNEELVRRNPPLVTVEFAVDKLIEVRDSIKVELLHMPGPLKPFMERPIICVFAIPERRMGEYRRESVRAVINMKGSKRGVSKFLPEITGLPPYTQILRNDSIRIKF